MSIRFSQTLERTYEVLRTRPWHAELAAVTIVRDVRGQIHLFLEGRRPAEQQELDLSQALSAEQGLGPYWSADLWWADEQGDRPSSTLSSMIRDQRRSAPWQADGARPSWYVLERHVAKQSWTEPPSEPLPLWPMDDVIAGAAPVVVAFFSFKGGLGRTTVTGATGLTLARYGHRVALVDLDLEAPGLASLFLAPKDEPTGVIDYLIEKPIQDKGWQLRESIHSLPDPLLLGPRGATLRLVPVGSVDADYLEKLARVDVQNIAEGSLGRILRELLLELRSALPGGVDFIFLDARAGLHELGGLALCNLAHAGVVLGIDSAQSWAGLALVVQRLARPEQEAGLPIVMVHAFAPLVEQPGGEEERREFVERSYDLFCERYYRSGEVPDLIDSDQPHTPLVIAWQPELRGELSLSVESQGQEKVKALVQRLTAGPYLQLAERLCMLFGRSLQRERSQ
ncbi:MAG: P-loop NTPase [Acidobacteriota bacterium]